MNKNNSDQQVICSAYVQNISVVAPGIANWQQAKNIFNAEEVHHLTAIDKLVPSILPANERRRTTNFIKLALHVAEQACLNNEEAKGYASIFAASDGDYEILDKNTNALTLPGRPVSPTNFHNSVHNAASGYWAIAAGSQKFSTSISAGDATFAAGLLEAMTFCAVESQPVLYVAYDYPPENILRTVRAVDSPFAAALVLLPHRTSETIAEIGILPQSTQSETVMQTSSLEALRNDNPTARALPLLAAIADKKVSLCHLSHVQGSMLSIKVAPCQS